MRWLGNISIGDHPVILTSEETQYWLGKMNQTSALNTASSCLNIILESIMLVIAFKIRLLLLYDHCCSLPPFTFLTTFSLKQCNIDWGQNIFSLPHRISFSWKINFKLLFLYKGILEMRKNMIYINSASQICLKNRMPEFSVFLYGRCHNEINPE